jgi:hypothetical protein
VKDEDDNPTGLVSGHAYGLMDAFEISISGKLVRLMRVRNPWGATEWMGEWGDDSEVLDKNRKVLENQYIKKLEVEERFTPGENDGTFLMTYEDWR